MTLDDVIAQQEIQNVLLRYFRAMDRVGNEIGYSIFHDDGVGDYGPGIFSGPGRELIEWLNVYNRTLITSHHQMSNSTIEVNGDLAASETYVNATLIRQEGGDYMVRSVYGRYIDKLSKRDGRWAIDSRFYRRDFFYEQKVADITIGESSSRTADDPSYAAFAELRS
ncbi:nuclear transport factor 2 family protein [Arthrobacter sp. MMS18-M83]|uniref:nuclear transport factor 2 family protein n=1 Tax=Arthrobacter sp. MMS18-M83 TaxID=2996261 RepID=UPI00227A3158|nr:nuclear transport factor 2 family protein [Arthrobacter sp. MMS18-M83]WAH97752.1 nuclear transport factor 2 family protein [Arthrobacter sp. MMS18-M83]